VIALLQRVGIDESAILNHLIPYYYSSMRSSEDDKAAL